MNYQEKVREFQVKGGEDLESGLTPLRESLLKEEINELKEAIANNDRVEILDALCDIIYVAYGTLNYTKETHKPHQADYYEPFVYDIKESIKNLEDYAFDDICISSVISVAYELAYLNDISLSSLEEALKRVHLSNMSKFPKSEQEAIETVKDYEKKGIETYYTDTFVVKRKSDNKTLKSINYNPVYLEDLI